jgi:hypothetical protein
VTRRHRWLAALALAYALVSLPHTSVADSDFRVFHESARAWLEGRSAYPAGLLPNMNPPWFTVALSPLAALPLGLAFNVWTAINVGLVAWTLMAIRRARPSVDHAMLAMCLVATLPAWYAWQKGQVTWLLFTLVTRAWLSPDRAALWLIPALMLKPPLAIAALLLPWRVGMTALAGALTGSVLLMGLSGLQPWQEWSRAGTLAPLVGWSSNASLWGIAARVEHGVNGVRIFDLSLVALMCVGIIGAVLAWLTVRTEGDRRWALVLLTSTLLSPLGWLYYLPLAFGPLAVFLRWSPWLIPVAAVWLLPRSALLALADLGLTELAVVSAVCVWIAAWRQPVAQHHID